ncbi:MAG TPA: hypothetical protein ENK26_07945 [Gammaproteobacteria bacterium]|nr:hypothetical protein [Gammaproteobacteria bacterium]
MSELRLYLLGIGILILLAIYFFGRKRHADSSHDVFANHQPDESSDPLTPTRRVPSMTNPGLFTGARSAPEEERLEPSLTEWDDPTEETEALPEPVELTDRVSEDELIGDPDLRVGEPLPELAGDTGAGATVPELASETGAGTPEAEPETPPPSETEPENIPEEPLAPIVVMYVVAKPDKPIPGAQALKAFHVHKLRFGPMDIFHRKVGSGSDAKIQFSIASMLKPGTLVPNEMSTRDLQGLSLFLKTDAVENPRQAYDDMLHVAQQLAYTLDAEVKDNTLLELTHEKIAAQRKMLDRLHA